jgi:TolB protein
MSRRATIGLLLIILFVSIEGCNSTDITTQQITENGRIVFYSGRNGNEDIYSMAADGSDLIRLTEDPAEDTCPAFSPDGRMIAFSSARDGNHELYLMNTDGSDLTRLTDTPGHEIQAAFSPNGQQIVYAVYTSATWADSDIFIMDVDGSHVRQLTDAGGEDARPDFTPDGRRIFFSSRRDGNYEIYFMDAGGENEKRVTDTEANELFPQVSPDGARIVYFIAQLSISTQIHIMNLDGSGDVALTQPGRVNEGAVWSPDGQFILFQSNRDGNYEIYIMDVDGANPKRLTENHAWDGWPDWAVKLKSSR